MTDAEIDSLAKIVADVSIATAVFCSQLCDVAHRAGFEPREVTFDILIALAATVTDRVVIVQGGDPWEAITLAAEEKKWERERERIVAATGWPVSFGKGGPF